MKIKDLPPNTPLTGLLVWSFSRRYYFATITKEINDEVELMWNFPIFPKKETYPKKDILNTEILTVYNSAKFNYMSVPFKKYKYKPCKINIYLNCITPSIIRTKQLLSLSL